MSTPKSGFMSISNSQTQAGTQLRPARCWVEIPLFTFGFDSCFSTDMSSGVDLCQTACHQCRYMLTGHTQMLHASALCAVIAVCNHKCPYACCLAIHSCNTWYCIRIASAMEGCNMCWETQRLSEIVCDRSITTSSVTLKAGPAGNYAGSDCAVGASPSH